MSFAWPLVLFALVAVPALIVWYLGRERGRAGTVAAFYSPAMTDSVAPRRPGWRRHVPRIVFLVAITLLIIAAARPEHTVAVPIRSGAVILANDISSSMLATDVTPSRLGAAQNAAERFLSGVPASLLVGQIAFARVPALLQTPSSDHALTRSAIAHLHQGGGGTAIGETIQIAVRVLSGLRQNGKRPPGAIVLLSDGSSNVGVSPLVAARQAKSAHIPVYTIALGTQNGTITFKRRGATVTAPVPVSTTELQEIAQASGGRFFTAADSARASSVYAHLAAQLGHRKVQRELTAGVAGGGLALLLIGSALSLFWFARLV